MNNPFAGWLTLAEASEELGVSICTMGRLVRSGDLEGLRFGAKWLVHEDAVDALIQRGYTGAPGRYWALRKVAMR